MLKCNAKGVENGYPLMIDPVRVEVIESDFNSGIHSCLVVGTQQRCLFLFVSHIGAVTLI
jgi:hypothetical protein